MTASDSFELFPPTERTPRYSTKISKGSIVGAAPRNDCGRARAWLDAGVRIAIATAIGLKAAANARLVGLPSICAIDQSEYLVVGDARRSSFFFAHVVRGCCLEVPKLASEVEIRAKLQASQQLPAIATQPLPQFQEVAVEHPSALRLVELATQVDCLIEENLEPIYLREPYITTPRQ